MSGAYGGQWREMVRMEYWREGVREFVKYTPNGTSMSAEMWGRRHRRILFALFAHLPVLLAIGLFEGSETQFTGITIPATPTWLVLTELGIVAGLGGLATWSRLGRRTRTVVAAFGLMTTSGLLVQFTGGYIEAHFHFFVVMGTIAIYEDWLPFLVGLAHVAVGHGVFSTIDSSRVYNHEAAIQYPWAWAVIHATFILMLVAALMTNWQSIERSREEADRRLEEVETKREEIESARAAKAEARDKHAEVQRLNEELAATADRYGEVMARAAAGDMTARIEAEDTTASMARIAASFDEMMDEMEAAVAEVSGFADEVLAASETAAASVSQAETASRTTTESVETISGSAVEQREMLDEVASEMSQLSATVEEVASSTASVAQRAEETAAIAQEGTATADEAAASTREVESTIETTVENVRSLDEQMTEIGEIADLIRDIAEQTNMLALNANIEAARAGGSGEDNSAGFAVVAGEVKSLAEETQQAATDIEDRIEAVQRQTTATVEEVQTAQRHTQASLEAVGEVREAFDRVAENADRTDEGVSEISRATDDQAASTEQAVSMVEDVAAISRSTADAADETTAATEQLSTAVSAVADETTSLTDRAARLRDRLQAFETSQTATDGQLATDGGAE